MHMSLCFEFVLFPINSIELMDVLSSRDYRIISPPPPRISPPARLEFIGNLAQKGGCVIDINPDKQILGVKGVDFEEIEQIYEELKEIIQNEIGSNFEQKVRFYELIGEYSVESDKRAIDSIANLFAQNDFLSQCSSVLDNELSIFTVRLAPKGQIPNQEEWFDINIAPHILKPSLFVISVVFRSKDESKVLTFARHSESKLLELIRVIQD